MPLTRYFDKPGNSKASKGPQVMAAMKSRYGSKAGERVFYATVNKMRSGSPAQRAAQPKTAPGAGARAGDALMKARTGRRRARRTQLSGPMGRFGGTTEGASTSTTRYGY